LETRGVVGVRADFAINLDETLGNNCSTFPASEGVLQAITEENIERKTLPELVRTSRWTGSLRQYMDESFNDFNEGTERTNIAHKFH
jgi:hypothetical protein